MRDELGEEVEPATHFCEYLCDLMIVDNLLTQDKFNENLVHVTQKR